MQVITLYYLLFKCLIQGLNKPAAIMYPVGKCSIRDRDVFPGKALLLAVQGQVIYVLVNDGLCQQPCACYGFGKRSVSYRGYEYPFSSPVCILRSYIAVDI